MIAAWFCYINRMADALGRGAGRGYFLARQA